MAITHATAADGTFSVTGAQEWNKAHTGYAGDGGFAFKYAFNTGTGSSPATGTIQYNNATLGSVTMMYINETDANGVGIDVYVDEFDVGDWIMLANADKSKYHVFIVSDQFTSEAGVDSLPVTYQFGTALFTNAETVYLSRTTGEFKYKLGRVLTLARIALI